MGAPLKNVLPFFSPDGGMLKRPILDAFGFFCVQIFHYSQMKTVSSFHVFFSELLLLKPYEQRGGGCAARIFPFLRCAADHERDCPTCYVLVFFGVGNQCAECEKQFVFVLSCVPVWRLIM